MNELEALVSLDRDKLAHKDNLISQASSDSTTSAKIIQDNIIFFAFFLILDASNLRQQTLSLHSKQLQANADAQIGLDNQLKNIQFYNLVSALYKTKRITIAHTHAMVSPNGVETYTTYTYKYTKVNINETAVVQQQMRNQRQNQIRQTVEGNLMAMRQEAEGQVARLNNNSNQEMQSIQEDAEILQILQQLTIKIMQIKFRT